MKVLTLEESKLGTLLRVKEELYGGHAFILGKLQKVRFGSSRKPRSLEAVNLGGTSKNENRNAAGSPPTVVQWCEFFSITISRSSATV